MLIYATDLVEVNEVWCLRVSVTWYKIFITYANLCNRSSGGRSSSSDE